MYVIVCLVLAVSQQVKPPTVTNDTSTAAYDARHCVLCWVYGDSDDDVSPASIQLL